MEIANAIKIRDALRVSVPDPVTGGTKLTPIGIVADNMLIFDERNDCIIWDDTNGLFWVICANPKPSAAGPNQLPMRLMGVQYLEIQYLYTAANETVAKQFVTNIDPNNKLISTTQLAAVLDKYVYKAEDLTKDNIYNTNKVTT